MVVMVWGFNGTANTAGNNTKGTLSGELLLSMTVLSFFTFIIMVAGLWQLGRSIADFVVKWEGLLGVDQSKNSVYFRITKWLLIVLGLPIGSILYVAIFWYTGKYLPRPPQYNCKFPSEFEQKLSENIAHQTVTQTVNFLITEDEKRYYDLADKVVIGEINGIKNVMPLNDEVADTKPVAASGPSAYTIVCQPVTDASKKQ